MRLIAFAALCAGMLCFPNALYAACTSPNGVAGEIIFNDDFKVMQYCDDVEWIGMGWKGNAGGGGSSGIKSMTTTERDAISSPTEGAVIYNTTLKTLQIFDGTQWQNLIMGQSGLGNSPKNAGADCKAIKTARPAATNGPYWITVGSNLVVRTQCDMTTDGGGWTLAMSNPTNTPTLNFSLTILPPSGELTLTSQGNLALPFFFNGTRELRWTTGASAQHLIAQFRENGTMFKRYGDFPGGTNCPPTSKAYAWTAVQINSGFSNTHTTTNYSCSGFNAKGAGTIVNYIGQGDCTACYGPTEVLIGNGNSGYYAHGNIYDMDYINWSGQTAFLDTKPSFWTSDAQPVQIWMR